MIVKYNVPNKYEEAPFGTVYRIMGDGEDSSLWIQVSQDSTPHWIKSGEFFEKIYNHSLEDKKFLNRSLEHYINVINNPQEKI